MDADHATPIIEISNFIKLIEQYNCDVLVGVLTYLQNESKWRIIHGMFAQILAHLIVFDKAVFDSQCGFKLFKNYSAKRIFNYCRVKGGMIDVEIFHLIHICKWIAFINQCIGLI